MAVSSVQEKEGRLSDPYVKISEEESDAEESQLGDLRQGSADCAVLPYAM